MRKQRGTTKGDLKSQGTKFPRLKRSLSADRADQAREYHPASTSAANFASAVRVPFSLSEVGTPRGSPSHSRKTSVPPYAPKMHQA